MLPRLSLFEIEDLPSCPAWLRNAMTGYLQTILAKTRPYAVAAEPLAALLRESGERRVVDLASGAGGPWPGLAEDLRRLGVEIELTCTDLYPNADAGRGLPFHPAPVSALAVPPDLPGARTMFTALHHFRPEEVRGLLASAQEAGVPFAAFEASHRSLRGLLVSLFVPIGVLLLMPFVRPRRLRLGGAGDPGPGGADPGDGPLRPADRRDPKRGRRAGIPVGPRARGGEPRAAGRASEGGGGGSQGRRRPVGRPGSAVLGRGAPGPARFQPVAARRHRVKGRADPVRPRTDPGAARRRNL